MVSPQNNSNKHNYGLPNGDHDKLSSQHKVQTNVFQKSEDLRLNHIAQQQKTMYYPMLPANLRPPMALPRVDSLQQMPSFYPTRPGLVSIPMSKNVIQWLRPISKHCTLDRFFHLVNEATFCEALNLFSLFFYNRPASRVSISMLTLFKAVLELGGYQTVCNI